MAKLKGPPPFVGTKFGVTIYRTYGQYYLRTASSLDAKRVKTDPAFRPLMRYAALLACASQIGAEVYRLVPSKKRKHPLYRLITGNVHLPYSKRFTPLKSVSTKMTPGLFPFSKLPNRLSISSAFAPFMVAHCNNSCG